MASINQTQLQVACLPSHQMQPRWLSALASLHYRAGYLTVYLEELVSGLRHGLGASRVMLGQRLEAGSYHFIVSPELQPDEPENPNLWSNLAQGIVTQKISGTGVCALQANLSVAYCGVPLETPQGENCGILLALRPTIEPFQVEDVHVLTLMATQAAMAIELERCCSAAHRPSIAAPGSGHPLQLRQGELLAVNQQLTQKLDHYRAELQRVSARLQVETIAHSSLEQRFRKIFEGSNDAIFVIDPSQDQILEANPRATKLLNYSRQELLNSIKISQVHPDEMPKLIAFTSDVFRNGQGWTDELTCLTKTKHKLAAEISAAPIDFDGRQCILAMVRDISTRKRLNAERKRAEANAQKALSHLAEVGELASMIVHEIRNPLTTVLMGLTSFQKLELDSRFQARLNMALEEAERLKRLLNEILLFSKPQMLDHKPLELNSWSADLLAAIESHPLVVDRVIQFTPNPSSVIVSADADKLKQVFINLLTNACEAIAPGETVTWEILHPSKADYLTVQINNGGKPIPPSIVEKMTTPFFTTKSHGNGLGLAIVKRIVTTHQGQLRVTSDAQSGTTVTVKLPILKH
ncbi:pas domain s-box [Leptolyngbya sp. Heron Island J]|uniref:two-component system sensor histidine kinase NtrB n=1 Tax=Leptolyngbya sp. Heron Island J TaxID=1385935 RepID=UPI0003B9738C|nr:ATP-binding protein [Leptolyngbya sp. Heron Island J]ESA33174.1 pas domain s-box [Leptolyngbya sp. Heron Island J]